MRTRVLNHFHTFHPDAQQRFNELAEQESQIRLEMARRSEVDEATRQRMSVKPRDLDAELADVRAQIDEQRKIIKSGVVRIHIKGLTRGEFRRLLTEHPPREDDVHDQRVAYNVDTFGEALIQACIIRTDDLDGNPVPNRWDEWAEDMTNGQWEEAFRACLELTNEGAPSLPR